MSFCLMCEPVTGRQHHLRRMKRKGKKYRDDRIGDHVLLLVRYGNQKQNPGIVVAYLVGVLGAGALGLRGGSTLGLGLGLLGRHGD